MIADHICLFIGNSRWHWAIKHKTHWSYLHTLPDPTKLQSNGNCSYTWASVGPIPAELYLDPRKEISLKNIPLFNLPPWLGIDRALSAWSAFKKAKSCIQKTNGILIADAGTVLSITKINAKGEFEGGQLLGGLHLQLSSMANATEKLSEPSNIYVPSNQFPLSTSDAMLKGTIQAIAGTLIEAQKSTNMPIWLCGGDSLIIFQVLKEKNISIYHHPNLVMEAMASLQDIFTED